MMRTVSQRLKYMSVLSFSALVLSGCATLDIDEVMGRTANSLKGFTDAELILKRTRIDNEHANAIVDELLDAPLTQSGIIRIGGDGRYVQRC